MRYSPYFVCHTSLALNYTTVYARISLFSHISHTHLQKLKNATCTLKTVYVTIQLSSRSQSHSLCFTYVTLSYAHNRLTLHTPIDAHKAPESMFLIQNLFLRPLFQHPTPPYDTVHAHKAKPTFQICHILLCPYKQQFTSQWPIPLSLCSQSYRQRLPHSSTTL